MYENFYNLRERPFALSPDPNYLYLSRVHREALDSLRYGIESRAGFIVVTGEIGAGKTTLLQALLQRLDNKAIVARVVNTTLEPRELLETIGLEFGLDTSGKSKPALLRELGQFLVEQRAQNRRPLLVIDEAQNLTAPALEEVRLLSNLETERSKLLQIVVAGQPNLRDVIATPELEQFRQRVAVSYHLTALDQPDTAAYIAYRLNHAAIGEPPRFPPDAAELVHGISGGVPRVINVICDAALIFGYAEERREIDAALIREVVEELRGTGVLPAGSSERPPAASPSPQPAPAAAHASSAGAAVAQPAVASHVNDPVFARLLVDVQTREVDLERREKAIVQRERNIADRERELLQQRRVLAEEYRLLRGPQTHAAGAAGTTRTAPQPAPVTRSPAPGIGVGLSWLRRVVFGEPPRTNELTS